MIPDMADILLVEDNPGDVVLTRKALERATFHNRLTVVTDGEEAVRYLETVSPKPDLILLDLNLPKILGAEVLQHVKGSPVLRRIPVIVLTSSESDEDVLRSFDLLANSYVVKPGDFGQLLKMVEALEEWWFVVCRLPPKE